MQATAARTACLLAVGAVAFGAAACNGSLAASNRIGSAPTRSHATGSNAHKKAPRFVATLATPVPASPRRVAGKDARRLLRVTAVLPGCSGGETQFTPNAKKLLAAPLDEPLGHFVDRHRFCAVAESQSVVMSWFASHPPKGGTKAGTGSASSNLLSESWQFHPWAVLPLRGSEVTTYPLSANETAVRVDGGVLYSPAKPVGETIPSGLTKIVLTVTPENGPAVTKVITSSSVINHFVEVVNGLRRADFSVNQGGIMITSEMAREEVRLGCFDGSRRVALVDEHPWLGEGTGNVHVRVAGKSYPVLLDRGTRLGHLSGRVARVKVTG